MTYTLRFHHEHNNWRFSTKVNLNICSSFEDRGVLLSQKVQLPMHVEKCFNSEATKRNLLRCS